MASFLDYILLFSVKVNTIERIFYKSSWPYNFHISFSSSKNRAFGSEYVFNSTYFLSSSQVSLFIFRSTFPLNLSLQEIFNIN